MTGINLMDFNNIRLDSTGTLEVSSHFRHSLYAKLGHNILELSKLVANPGRLDESEPLMETTNTLYVLRNLTADLAGAMTTIDSSYESQGERFLGGSTGFAATYARKDLIIGTAEDATPELKLDSTAHPHHLLFRLGSLAGNLHFMNMEDHDDPDGAIIYLHQDDVRGIYQPRREIDMSRGFVTREDINKRWTRDQE